MKILILNWKDIKHPKVGGAEIIVFELAKRLIKKGYEVTWFSQSFPGCKSEEIIEDIKVVRRGGLMTSYVFAPIYYWSLHKKPDLVIDMSNTIYWQTPLWAWKSIHLAYLNQFAKQVFFYEFPPVVSHFGYFVERIQYLTYLWSKFICYSNGTKHDLVENGIKPENISMFSLGIDHSRYIPGKKSETPLFLCVSRLVKMKRTDLAIKAMSIVVKKHPKAILAISGTGYHLNYLVDLVSELGLQENVKFVNKDVWYFEKNSKDQKLELMQKSWGLIFPSVKEGWGMTVTECAACGTPAIVTDVTGLQDSVLRDKTGIVVSSDPTPNELAKAMTLLIEDKKLREKMSREAISYAKTFDWERSAKEFESILKSLF